MSNFKGMLVVKVQLRWRNFRYEFWWGRMVWAL